MYQRDQISFAFSWFCQTVEFEVDEGCVLVAVVGDAVDADGDGWLTTTTGFTKVVVLRYWAFTSGICPTDLRIGVVIIFPARLDGARMWAVTWLPWETTVIGVTIGVRPERGACWPTMWAILSVDGAVCIIVEPGLPAVVWSDTPVWLKVNPVIIKQQEHVIFLAAPQRWPFTFGADIPNANSHGAGTHVLPIHTIGWEYIQFRTAGKSCQLRAITSDQCYATDHLMRSLRVSRPYSRLRICNNEAFS